MSWPPAVLYSVNNIFLLIPAYIKMLTVLKKCACVYYCVSKRTNMLMKDIHTSVQYSTFWQCHSFAKTFLYFSHFFILVLPRRLRPINFTHIEVIGCQETKLHCSVLTHKEPYNLKTYLTSFFLPLCTFYFSKPFLITSRCYFVQIWSRVPWWAMCDTYKFKVLSFIWKQEQEVQRSTPRHLDRDVNLVLPSANLQLWGNP